MQMIEGFYRSAERGKSVRFEICSEFHTSTKALNSETESKSQGDPPAGHRRARHSRRRGIESRRAAESISA